MSLFLSTLLLCAAPTTPALQEAPAVRPPIQPPGQEVASVDQLVAAGRALLASGKLEEAQAAFDGAAELDGDSPRTRLWVARGWIARWQVDEALEAADELRQGELLPATDLDYLYGLAFYTKALRDVTQGRSGPTTEDEFSDAVARLERVLEADPLRYDDAWQPLAEAAWYARDLERAAEVAAHLVELRPDDATAYLVQGRIAFSRYSAARSEEAPPDELQARWAFAEGAFRGAVRVLGQPTEELPRWTLAGAWAQIGDLHLWQEDPAGAARAYGEAMTSDPRAVDFQRLLGSLELDLFAGTVEGARKTFKQRRPDEVALISLLTWWQAYANFQQADYPKAEVAFRETVEANPDNVNAWYYVFRSTFGQQKFEQAVEALRTFYELDLDSLVAAVGAGRELDLPILEYLGGWCANAERHEDLQPRLDDATLIADLTTRVAPDDARYWNNLGLFLRDRGEQLRDGTQPPESAVLDEFWERAYAAYQHTLELEPENPGYLNDTAVMLHYYLKRDWPEALAMYSRAGRLAERELAREDLTPDYREWMQTARRDALDNHARLQQRLTRRRGPVEAGSPTPRPEGHGGGLR